MEEKKNYIKVERHKWPDEVAAEKKRTRKRFFIVFVCIACFVGGFMLSSLRQTSYGVSSQSKSEDSDKFNEIYNIMQNEWYFGKDVKNLSEFLMDNAINGLTSNEYDAHTNYLNSDSASQFLQKLEGSLVGIGIQYTNVGDDVMIKKVYLDSPAQKAGLKEGDLLKKISGISLKGKSLNEIADLAKGEEGSVATFIIDRDGKEMSFDITRETLSLTVYGYIKDGVGVLELSSFSERTHEEVEAYFKQFKKENVDRIVIDMRDNTGGYLNTVVKIASMLMEKDKVVIQEKDRDGKISESYTSEANRYEFDDIVVLVNEKTASASEALAACLKEQLEATIVGVTTYGKGTEQISKVFSDGTYLKYTVAEWLTPNGNSINLKGITPDVVVENDLALTYKFVSEDASYQVDSVGENVKLAQIYLKFLGYNIDRVDGYFSSVTLDALHQFAKDTNVNKQDVIDQELVEKLYKKATQTYASDSEKYDIQLKKAIEVAHGK
ncbi:MAG: PDZ domain-containing protein [Erysipelotrichia bacterium]|nr:PDZ domain-containing protein [Erysipelotrichia bacterium]